MEKIANIYQAKEKLLETGVENLKKHYPKVDKESILTDFMYASFFKTSLELTYNDLPVKPENQTNQNTITHYRSACKLLIGIINKNLKTDNETV